MASSSYDVFEDIVAVEHEGFGAVASLIFQKLDFKHLVVGRCGDVLGTAGL